MPLKNISISIKIIGIPVLNGLLLVLLTAPLLALSLSADTSLNFVGSSSCETCHPEQYESYHQYANKAHSFLSITKMKKGLTATEYNECLACHTTGYGEPGGFVSEKETPELKNAGCEVCHGPGSAHIETEDPDDIIAEVTIDTCKRCHTPERVDEFKYKPVLHGGAH